VAINSLFVTFALSGFNRQIVVIHKYLNALGLVQNRA